MCTVNTYPTLLSFGWCCALLVLPVPLKGSACPGFSSPCWTMAGDELAIRGQRCRMFAAPSHWDETGLLMQWQDEAELTLDRFDARLLLEDRRQFRKKRMYTAPAPTVDVEHGELETVRWCSLPLGSHTGVCRLVEDSHLGEHGQLGRLEPFPNEDAEVEDEVSLGARVGFSYGATTASVNSADTSTTAAATMSTTAPASVDPLLGVPGDMLVPETQGQLEVIMRTAKFIRDQGPQMEVLMRAKQATNAKFQFLTPGDRLHPFYKHVLVHCKQQATNGKLEEKGGVNSKLSNVAVGSEQGKEPEQPCPAVDKSVLANGVQDEAPRAANLVKLAAAGRVVASQSLIAGGYSDDSDNDTETPAGSNKGEALPSSSDEQEAQVSPSAKRIKVEVVANEEIARIEKVARYVARNGLAFEQTLILQFKDNGAYRFLNPWDPQHALYKQRLHGFQRVMSSAAEQDSPEP